MRLKAILIEALHRLLGRLFRAGVEEPDDAPIDAETVDRIARDQADEAIGIERAGRQLCHLRQHPRFGAAPLLGHVEADVLDRAGDLPADLLE